MEGISKFGGSSAGQIVLPLLMGAASVFAPRVASGIGGGLQLATNLGELNRKRSQSATLRDYMAQQGGLPGGIDPTKIPDELLGGVLGHQMSANEPKQWFTDLGDEKGVVTSPKVGGTPTFTPVGPKAPSWDQAHKTKSYIMGFGTNPGPEQMKQVDEALKADENAKQEKQLDTYTQKQGILLEKQQGLQDRSLANQQSRAEESYKRQTQERDIAAGRTDYGKLTTGYRSNMNALDKEYQKQLGALYSNGQPLLPADKLKAKKDEISAQYLEAQGKIREDYMASYEDWQGTYKHVLPYLPGTGGLPKVIQRMKGGQQKPAKAERPWMDME